MSTEETSKKGNTYKIIKSNVVTSDKVMYTGGYFHQRTPMACAEKIASGIFAEFERDPSLYIHPNLKKVSAPVFIELMRITKKKSKKVYYYKVNQLPKTDTPKMNEFKTADGKILTFPAIERAKGEKSTLEEVEKAVADAMKATGL